MSLIIWVCVCKWHGWWWDWLGCSNFLKWRACFFKGTSPSSWPNHSHLRPLHLHSNSMLLVVSLACSTLWAPSLFVFFCVFVGVNEGVGRVIDTFCCHWMEMIVTVSKNKWLDWVVDIQKEINMLGMDVCVCDAAAMNMIFHAQNKGVATVQTDTGDYWLLGFTLSTLRGK